MTLFLRHSTPHAIRFANGEGVVSALSENGARGADLLSGYRPAAAGPGTLSLGVEELFGIHLAALAEILPVPEVVLRPWEATDLRHTDSHFRARCGRDVMYPAEGGRESPSCDHSNPVPPLVAPFPDLH